MSGILQWFLDSGHANLVTYALSVVAIAVSVFAWITSWQTQKRLVVIEEARERDRLKHASKAKLRAELVREPGSRRMRELLRVYNDGEVEARNVAIKLAGKPLLEHPAVPGGTTEIKKVGPRSQIQYVIAVTLDNAPPWEFELTWTDDSGQEGSYRTTLTL
ncbi:MAG: hypothetical protein ACRD2L_17425 [Terriglobia bacterium]